MDASDHNKARSYRWRSVVAMLLENAGVIGVDGQKIRPKSERSQLRLSEYFANSADGVPEQEVGDIAGLSRVLVNTKAAYKKDFSGALDEAAADAEHDGKEFFAVAFTRPGRLPQEGYAVTRLDTFAAMVAELEGKP